METESHVGVLIRPIKRPWRFGAFIASRELSSTSLGLGMEFKVETRWS